LLTIEHTQFPSMFTYCAMSGLSSNTVYKKYHTRDLKTTCRTESLKLPQNVVQKLHRTKDICICIYLVNPLLNEFTLWKM